MRRRLRQALLAAACGCVSQAAVLPSFTLDQLVRQSGVIAHGRVTRSWCAWDSSHKYIWTHYSFAVIDPLRGAQAGAIEIAEPGGSLDGLHMQVSGAVAYAIGEEAVVFLYRTPVGYWRAFGGVHGKYTVGADRHVSLDGLTVSEFKTQIREAIRRQR